MVVDKANMVSGSSIPQHYAGLQLHVLSFGEHEDEYCKVPIKVLVGPGKQKNRLALLSASVSAQDLRTLEMERDKKDLASSPRGVLEACLTTPGSDPPTTSGSDPPTTSGSDPPTPMKKNDKAVPVTCTASKSLSRWTNFFKLWKRRSMRQLAISPPVTLTKMSKAKSGSEREGISPILSEIYSFKSKLRQFSYADLSTATDNFSPDNLIGQGGCAKVYQGLLPNGQYVAVKKLTKGSADERTASFLSELGIIAHVNHPNTANLIGCGVEGGMHLVFQLSPLGSLGSILHGSGSKGKLEWSKRYKIALGTANGLLYLHENCQKRIIHRDIKADNILLTEDFEPQICDFGLAKWLPKQWTHHNVSKFEGTFGYFAPEYFMHGVVDEKTDVYAFGVLLLELITGKKALDHLQKSVVLWAKPLIDKNAIEELIDPSLGDTYDPEEMNRVIMTASLCIEQSPALRPRMQQVIEILKGDDAAPKSREICSRRLIRRTYSEELLDAQEYNSTRYLSSLRRHGEVALGS